MAGDTRESSPPESGSSASGESKNSEADRNSSKNFEVFNSPPQSANALPPGSGQNTAGSKLNNKTPNFFDALKTIRLQDFTQVHMYPCVRESLLMGMGAGFSIGGVRSVLGGRFFLRCLYYPSCYIFLLSKRNNTPI
jgi:cytochrome c oxidase assembly protein subunit 20